MSESDLVIDLAYRQTFNKHDPAPELRAELQAARRFLLDDAMAAFIMDVSFETLGFAETFRQAREGRATERSMKRLGKKAHAALDSVRYYSRLPHRLTWFEFSDDAFIRRQIELSGELGFKEEETLLSSPDDDDGDDGFLTKKQALERLEQAKGSRTGWLLRQLSETSFDCRAFSSKKHEFEGVRLSSCCMVWDTEDNMPPPKLMEPVGKILKEYTTASEVLTAIGGYKRSNVGIRFVESPGQQTRLNEKDEDANLIMLAGHGDLRYLWCLLATINKIPLVTAEPVKPSKGFIGRGSYRRFLEHTIIKLNVPAKISRRVLAKKVLGDILRRRAHQVRGHWRDDWRQPKGNKTMWVGEHQRGDASLGFVTHDYEVHANKETK